MSFLFSGPVCSTTHPGFNSARSWSPSRKPLLWAFPHSTSYHFAGMPAKEKWHHVLFTGGGVCGRGTGLRKEEPFMPFPGSFPGSDLHPETCLFCPFFPYNWTVQVPSAVHRADTIPVSPLDTATDPTQFEKEKTPPL